MRPSSNSRAPTAAANLGREHQTALEGTQGAPRKMRRQCAATPRACCPQPSLAAAAASLALSKTPAVLTSTRHASETTAAPGGCGGLTNPGAAETPRARAPSSSSRPRAPSLCENLFSNHKVPQRHPNRPCGSREQVRAKAEGPGVFKKDYRGSAPRFRPTRAHSTLEHTGAAAAGFKQTTESSAVVEADGDKGKYLRICLLSSSPGRVRGSASSARLMPSLFRETRWPSRELYTTLLQKPRIRTRS